ncbi:G-type lectin S-receptor-like serine/threonine-protein kinase RLK1 [Ananas comosus]|uniref:non-specific serine/threonine protein kinase n=1 Tax=Ananas comosus TaxID=4615 RepID=A0A199W599_ANACO|nr:G-type lectin S-receptor-like serine/threonine-protein kinase RLK1 [Ananas comosus]
MAFIVLSILLLLTLVSAQNKQINITLGSSITAADGAGWFSPSGRFAFGFYPKGLTGFAIGVWLATSPNRTIVWTASRDDPPLTDGSITLTFDGRLLWSASGGQEKAISQASEPVTTASMLDDGNFVLYDTATDGFREMLGKEPLECVQRGIGKGEKVIAVKRLEKMVEDGEREFQREALTVVVYEFMSNGSLANLLFRSENCPAWKERVKIALDVAKGLQYLHEELESHIIHCDIKPQNILMDGSGTAR